MCNRVIVVFFYSSILYFDRIFVVPCFWENTEEKFATEISFVLCWKFSLALELSLRVEFSVNV